jgi:hypothetical protein
MHPGAFAVLVQSCETISGAIREPLQYCAVKLGGAPKLLPLG